jgi:autotransporter-associated beta strand protein
MAMIGVLAAQFKAQAIIDYWDNNGTAAATSGTWDAVTPQWSTTTSFTASPVIWDPTAAAGFPVGNTNLSALTITVNSALNFAGLFNGLTNGANNGAGVTNLTIKGSGSLSINSGLQGFWTGQSYFNTMLQVALTGTGGLQNQSSGSLFLSGTNSYSGGTSIGTSAGLNIANGFVFGTGPITNATSTTVLALPAADNVGNTFATAAVTITNSWATFGGSSTEILVGLVAAPVTFSGPWTLAGVAGTTTTLDVRTTTWTISGAIGGAGNLSKKNTAQLTLSGANTYTGSTVVQNGAVSVTSLNKVSGGSASSSLGAPTTVANGTIGLGATTTAGTLLYTGAGETTDRVIDLAGTTGGATIQNDGSGALTFSSALTASGVGAKTLTLQGANAGNNTISGKIVDSSSGATALTKAGAGKWILSGANTYSGATTVSVGTLAQGAANVIPSGTGKGTFAVSSGATFDLAGFDSSIDGFGTSAGTIDNTTGSGTYTLTMGNNNGAGTHSGVIKNTSGTLALTKVGTGAIVISGANTFSGKTIINGGTLTINTSGDLALGTPPASPVAD